MYFKYRFTSYKAEQPIQDMVLQEKEEDKDEKHIGELIRKNPKMTGAYNSRLRVI